MDFKDQLTRGVIEGDWDQRKSTGSFRGAPEGMHVKTLMEFRDDGEVADILTNPERLVEFVKPGDNVIQVYNRINDFFTETQPAAIGQLASLGGLGGDGPVHHNMFAYDND